MGEKGDGKTLHAIALSVLKERLTFPKVKIVVNALPVFPYRLTSAGDTPVVR